MNAPEPAGTLLSEESLRDGARYARDTIRTICETLGPRPPGSDGERRCQETLRDELASAGLVPALENFSVAPRAFMAVPTIAGWLSLAAIGCYWLSPLASSTLLLAALALLDERGLLEALRTVAVAVEIFDGQGLG